MSVIPSLRYEYLEGLQTSSTWYRELPRPSDVASKLCFVLGTSYGSVRRVDSNCKPLCETRRFRWPGHDCGFFLMYQVHTLGCPISTGLPCTFKLRTLSCSVLPPHVARSPSSPTSRIASHSPRSATTYAWGVILSMLVRFAGFRILSHYLL